MIFRDEGFIVLPSIMNRCRYLLRKLFFRFAPKLPNPRPHRDYSVQNHFVESSASQPQSISNS